MIRRIAAILLIVPLLLSVTGCDTKSRLHTTVADMECALDENFVLFSKSVNELTSCGTISVYKNQQEIKSIKSYVVAFQDLIFVSDRLLSEDEYTFLYDTIYPLFAEYSLTFVGNFSEDRTTRFTFEEEYGQIAFLEYSKEDPRQTWTLLPLESKQIQENWYAAILSD